MCNTGLFSPVIQKKCEAGTLTITDLFGFAIRAHPEVYMNLISSKADSTQIRFTQLLAATLGNALGARLTAEEFYKSANLLLQDYAPNPNVGIYLVNGQQHCFTNTPFVMTATPLGPQTS